MKYDAKEKKKVEDQDALNHLLQEVGLPFYVYVLCYPPKEDEMAPFYIGIGQSGRIFEHEKEAEQSGENNLKLETIRKIWSAGDEVVRVIDSLHAMEPWGREEELINQFGLVKDSTGVLTNEQRYSPSNTVDGIELRKYSGDGNVLPGNFIRRDTRLVVGPRRPGNPNSVYGKITEVLASNPGITGEELVELLLLVDFSGNKSAYTATGRVSKPWLAKYIDGGFYEKNQYIREYTGKDSV